MDIQKTEFIPPYKNADVQLKKCGNLWEIMHQTSTAVGGKIKKLDRDNYLEVATGEVKEYRHNINRGQITNSIHRSMRYLRDIINCNVTSPENCLWCTFTYKDCMQDSKQLYEDNRRFIQRLQYYLKKHNLPSCSFITTAEPQQRGAWHLHTILLFPQKAPFIPNATMRNLWRNGFVNVQSLKDAKNAGLYLTAYLTNLPLETAIGQGTVRADSVKTVSALDENGKRVSKAVVKGQRLFMYPVGFRLFRCSRDIKRPIVSKCTEAQAQAELQGAKLVYQKSVCIKNEAEQVVNSISYRQYDIREKE